MNAALARRVDRFTNRLGRGQFEANASALVWRRLIPPPLLAALQDAVRAYVLRSLPSHVPRFSDVSLELEWHREEVKTISVGGIIVPKRDSVLEYNAVARVFVEIGHWICGAWIGQWHVPPNVRVKFPQVTAEQLARPRPSERPHSDCWAGEHPDSVTLHVPLFGDCESNYVSTYLPTAEFEERWLDPAPSNDPDAVRAYETGMCGRWGPKHGEPTQVGYALLLDSSVLHASHREPGCGTRVSIEAPFVWRDAPPRDALLRAAEHLPHHVMLGLGATHLLHFPDTPGMTRETSGGTQHSAKWRVLELEEDRDA